MFRKQTLQRLTRFAALMIAPLFFCSCFYDKNEFGGTQEVVTYQTVARDLVNSSDLLFWSRAQDAHQTGGVYDYLTNQKVDGQYPAGTLDLEADDNALVTMNSGWLSLIPPTNNKKLRSPNGETLDLQDLSVVMLVKNTSRGNILLFDPQDETTEAFSVQMSASQVKARFQASPGNYYESTLNLPTSDSSIIATSFGSSSDDLFFTVNGALAGTATEVGTVGFPTLLTRYLAVGPNLTTENLLVRRLYVFSRSLSKKELGSMIVYMAEQEGISGIQLDPSLQISTGSADPNYLPVKSILASRCLSCHSAWNGASANYFVTQGLVTKGNPEASPLYYRLLGSSGSGGPKNMPLSGSVSSDDRQAIKYWIENFP